MGIAVPYVSQRAVDRAWEFERRICTLPVEAGIIFAGVRAIPVPGGESTEFVLTVGIDRAFEVKSIEAVLRNVFGQEIADGDFTLTFKVSRGTVGLAAQGGHKAVPGPNPVQA